tara:strand:- start:36 stop:362 length:327 start_codon:yes stop_codon:yes gene_type:complete
MARTAHRYLFESAFEAMEIRTQRCFLLLRMITHIIDQHEREFVASGSKSWGWAGNLEEVELRLLQIISFMTQSEEAQHEYSANLEVVLDEILEKYPALEEVLLPAEFH